MSVPALSTPSDACAICMDVLQKEDKKMSCSHIFHEACINEWFKTSNTCPLCRYTFTDITPTIRHHEEMRRLNLSEDPEGARTVLRNERSYRLNETLERVAQMAVSIEGMSTMFDEEINMRLQQQRLFDENQQVLHHQHPSRVRRLARHAGKIFHRTHV
jgi:hypothetical protein